tara:strand:+ start:1111 stop:1320 length:210 start_codon:yes stop_codon:yes gene_type:complete
MSKIKKLFVDYEDDTSFLEIFCNSKGKISVRISDCIGEHIIAIDISTAISFSKELRKEINIAKTFNEYE